MYTNQMRMTGLSGLDTESMVKQLMKAESIKYDRLYQQRQLTNWKQLAYQSVTTSLLNFQNNFLSYTTNASNNLRSIANFKGLAAIIKNSAGAESNAVTVKTSSTTIAGDYKLKVNQIAKADIYKSSTPIASSLVGEGNININNIKVGDSIKVSLDGAAAREIVFDADFMSTVTDEASFGAALNAKLAQMYGSDVGGQKITAGVKTDGSSFKLVIEAGKGHTASLSGGAKVGDLKLKAASNYVVPASDIENATFTIEIGGQTLNVNVGTIKAGTTAKQAVNQINKAIAKAVEDSGVSGISGVTVSLDGDKMVITNGNGALKAKITDGPDGLLGQLGFDIGTATKELDNASALSALGVKSGQNTNLDINKSIWDLFPDAIDADGSVTFTINNRVFKFEKPTAAEIAEGKKETTLKELMASINTANIGVKVSFNSTRSEFTMESTNTGQANAISFSAGGFLEKAFGFKDDSSDATPVSHVSVAQDAEIELNGLLTTRETNNFTLEGLNITLTSAAENQTFDISLRKDTTETMALIKNFVADYNKLIESINKQLNTPRPKSGNYSYYEPLTKEEKAALSDKEVADWEKEAMTGMLYRDPTLSSLQSQLRGMLYQSVEMEDGTKLSLFQLGITTSSKLSEAGYLQIDEDKLQKALNEMPDKVAQFFTKQSDFSASDKANRSGRLATEGLSERINDIINWTAAYNGTLYNKAGLEGIKMDSEMSKKLKEQDDKISDMLTYLAKRETYYYNMFSKLEVAMNQANSQMSALQSMLGINS